MTKHPIEMRHEFRGFGIKILIFGVVMAAACAAVVMGLWNWMMPVLFGWKAITYWQALGLLVLCRVLFGGHRGPRWGGGPGRFRRRQMWQKWAQMTPEERDKFRAGLHCPPERERTP